MLSGVVVHVAHGGDPVGHVPRQGPARHVRVRVDEAGDDPAPRHVHLLRPAGKRDVLARADRLDGAAADQHHAVAKRRAAPSVEDRGAHQGGARRALLGAGAEEEAERRGSPSLIVARKVMKLRGVEDGGKAPRGTGALGEATSLASWPAPSSSRPSSSRPSSPPSSSPAPSSWRPSSPPSSWRAPSSSRPSSWPASSRPSSSRAFFFAGFFAAFFLAAGGFAAIGAGAGGGGGGGAGVATFSGDIGMGSIHPAPDQPISRVAHRVLPPPAGATPPVAGPR